MTTPERDSVSPATPAPPAATEPATTEAPAAPVAAAPVGDWGFPTQMVVGAGRSAELAGLCRTHGIERPLVVTDPGLARLDMVSELVARLEHERLGVAMFDGVRPNPTGDDVTAGTKAFAEGRHDGVVAVGGGSALDVGKLIAFMTGQHRPVWDFEDVGDNWTRADPDRIAPTIAVPTTAGTGSEVGRAGVVTEPESHTKRIIFHPLMLPVAVVCDPELTVGMPRPITVGTGMDAFSHSLEAFCAPGYHPYADGIANEGMRLVADNIERVAADPTDLEARTHMMSAAAMGATAFQKGLGAMHALSHPLGAHFDTHHGMTNATLMPYVLAFNRRWIEDRVAGLAHRLGFGGGFDGMLDWLVELRSELGVPHTLGELGVGPDRLGLIAPAAVLDPSAGGNPRPLDLEGATRILDAASTGRLDQLGD